MHFPRKLKLLFCSWKETHNIQFPIKITFQTRHSREHRKKKTLPSLKNKLLAFSGGFLHPGVITHASGGKSRKNISSLIKSSFFRAPSCVLWVLRSPERYAASAILLLIFFFVGPAEEVVEFSSSKCDKSGLARIVEKISAKRQRTRALVFHAGSNCSCVESE